MSASVEQDETARLEAALGRIGRAASGLRDGGAPASLEAGMAAARREADLVARLDGLIAELRALLGSQP